MTEKKKTAVQLILAVAGVFAAVYGVICFNGVLMGIPVAIRMWLAFILQWFIAVVPVIIVCVNKEKPSRFGFSKEKLAGQLLAGLAVAAAFSLLFTVTPILLDRRDFVGTPMYTLWWQFIYDFVYKIFGVALVEEFIFRGFIFEYLLKLNKSRWFAIIVSSVLFGLFHIFGGSIVQVLVTTVIGFLLCVAREKIKGCTTLSLVVAHGAYDALINVLLAVM